MSGFFQVAFKGEYFNQAIVNILHYRSAEWLPGQGNPFDDTLAALDAVVLKTKTALLNCLPTDYTLQTVEGVGYDDTYKIVTPSPMVRTISAAGTYSDTLSMGAAQCAIISLRCGGQVQINLLGQSLRNRGYVAIGPLPEAAVDNYSHLTATPEARLDVLAQTLDDSIIMLAPAVTLVPIRIHEKWANILGVKVLQWRTYSDVLGYAVRRVASYRRSRQPEA
jgi:hypothetical protein